MVEYIVTGHKSAIENDTYRIGVVTKHGTSDAGSVVRYVTSGDYEVRTSAGARCFRQTDAYDVRVRAVEEYLGMVADGPERNATFTVTVSAMRGDPDVHYMAQVIREAIQREYPNLTVGDVHVSGEATSAGYQVGTSQEVEAGLNDENIDLPTYLERLRRVKRGEKA